MSSVLKVFLIVLLLVLFLPVKESLAACTQSYAGKTLVTRWQPIDVGHDWTYSAQISPEQVAKAGILVAPDGVFAEPDCVSSRVEDGSGYTVRTFSNSTEFDTYGSGEYRVFTSYSGPGSPAVENGAYLSVIQPCPYSSIEPAFRVRIDGDWKEWKNTLNISQWQTDEVQAATFYNGTGNTTDLDKVQMVFSGSFLNSNPADVSGLIGGVGHYAVGATGIGICGSLGTATASLNVVYCPYEEIAVNSNRGRSGDPWLPDITVNKKDVKAGTVQSGTYYNNGSGNQWSALNNLNFDITKPSGEVLDFDANPKLYPVPPSWYTNGLYLNYPGTYHLQAMATNNGVSCGDYPPESQGTINVINCSYDTTVAGFQNVASPRPAWTASLYLPYTGATVKSAGFHDRSLSSIPPAVDDIKVFTPAEQVILRITGPGSFDQRADQGAPFTYTLGGTYTLSVTTPDLDTDGPDDIEDGVGCYASASLTLGGEPPPNACVDTEERIPCCPFTLSGESLWSGLVNVLNELAVWLLAHNGLAPFKMGVSVDKIEFTADRTKQANLLFGQKKTDGTLEYGSVFKLSPPGEISKCAIRTDDSDEAKIAKRETRVSWDVSLEGGSGPLKEGDIADVDPTSCASDQIQGYLTRLPGVGVTPVAQLNQNLSRLSQSISLRAAVGSRPPQTDSRSQGAPAGQTPGVEKPAGQVLGEAETLQCIGQKTADYMNAVIDGAGSLSKVKLLSPAFNMTSYTFGPIITAMRERSARFSDLSGIAGNIYNVSDQTITNFLNDALAIAPEFNGRDLYLTEIGDYPGDTLGLSDLRSEITRLKSNATVKAALLFNAFNSNLGWSQFALTDPQIQDACSGGCGKIGVNSASAYYQDDPYYSRGQNLSMGGNLEIAFNPGNLESTIQGIIRSQSRSLTPILRVCSGNTCDFSNPQTYIDFLHQVENDARVGGPVFAIAGPNEPDAEHWLGDCTALTPTPTPTPTPAGTPSPTPINGPSCQENLVRPVKQVECYESGDYGSEPNTDINNLLLLLQNSNSLIARVSLIDVLSRSLVGAVTVCDTNGRGCTDQTISQNAGALDLFKVPQGKGYKNVAAEGKISPIRFTVEIGSPIGGIPGPVMWFLFGAYGIPLTGSGVIPADEFNPNLRNCSVVYTGQGTFSDINSPKLSCVYIINDPELKARYWGSVQSAFYNTNLASAEPGVQCKLDIPGGTVCAGQGTTSPVVTPPPGFTGACTICNFNRGGSGRTLEDLLDEVAGAVGTPASVLAGMLNFEGYVPDNPDPSKRHIFNYSDEEIAAISAPGASMPYCAESDMGARGPCQFMPSQWNAYGDTINSYGYAHTPNICNLRDCLYASAAKMRNDAGILGQACGYNNDTPPPAASCAWTNDNAAKGAYHYYGACTDNYVTTVVNYYNNYTCQTGGP